MDTSQTAFLQRSFSIDRSVVVSFGKIAFFLAAPLFGSVIHITLYFLLAAWALRSPRASIEALTLSALLSFLNPGIYDISDQGTLLRWLVIGTSFTCVTLVALRKTTVIPRVLKWVIAFVVVAATLSLIVSYEPGVSIFKLVSFAIGAATILMAFHLTRHDSGYWERWYLLVAGIVSIASFPLIFTEVGYYVNGRGFQGIFNHPQAYGIFLGALFPWVTMLLLEKRLSGVWPLLITIAGITSLFLTEARTAILAAGCSFFFVTAWAAFYRQKRVKMLSVWIIRFLPITGILFVFLASNAHVVGETVTDIIFKRDIDSSLVEAFWESRGVLLNPMLENIAQNPMMGIGFGVASEQSDLVVNRDPYIGLPISAPVEKGFAIVATLEEVGLIGFIVYIALVVSLLRSSFRSQYSLAPATLSLSALLVNFGESVFFSIGGMGMIIWLLFGAALTMTLQSRR